MTKLEKLMALNKVKTIKAQTDADKIAELEQIIEEQNMALMELSELIVGGEE